MNITLNHNNNFLNSILDGNFTFFSEIKINDQTIYDDKNLGIIILSFYRKAFSRSLIELDKEKKEKENKKEPFVNNNIEAFLIDEIDSSLSCLKLISPKNINDYIYQIEKQKMFDSKVLRHYNIIPLKNNISLFNLALSIIEADFYNDRCYWLNSY